MREMSKGYLALGLTMVVTASTIFYVHWDQKRELHRMRQGVYRDAERERLRREVLDKQNQQSQS